MHTHVRTVNYSADTAELPSCYPGLRTMPQVQIICSLLCAALLFLTSCSTPNHGERVILPLTEIIRTVTPSVVRLNVEINNSFRIEPDLPVNRSSGTGVIIDSNGHIVTSLHVIQSAGDELPEQILTTLSDGRSFKASIVGSDERLDLCVLKIDAPELSPATFGDSRNLEAGDKVMTIGYAYDFAGPPSISSGIVSAIRRGFSQSGFVIPDAIQTDAAIHPGNSGGPLVNRQGEVIGINVAVAAWTRYVGFAISSAVVLPAVESIIQNGTVRRAYLGVATEITSVEIPQSSPTEKGVSVIMVMEDSPAFKAGMQPGDFIISLMHEPINNGSDLMPLLYMHKPGDDIVIALYRDGRRRTVTVTLEARPHETLSSPAPEY
jgi:serine protease Do